MANAKTLKRISTILWITTYLLTAIALLMVARRILTLSGLIKSFNPSGGSPFDGGFSGHPMITLIHILPGILFMLLGPLQFMPGIRAKHIRFHRWSGRIFISASYVVGFSALSMPFIMSPIGGLNEAVGSILFALFFLVSLTKAWVHILRKEISLHREWMIRAFAIGLAIATVRPIIVLFLVFSGLPPQVFFGTAFWLGFTIHLITAEIWINYTRSQRRYFGYLKNNQFL